MIEMAIAASLATEHERMMRLVARQPEGNHQLVERQPLRRGDLQRNNGHVWDLVSGEHAWLHAAMGFV
jgi:hypothetical protein